MDKKPMRHPDSLNNDEATVIYVIVMILGALFYARWIIWIAATIIWFRYINYLD